MSCLFFFPRRFISLDDLSLELFSLITNNFHRCVILHQHFLQLDVVLIGFNELFFWIKYVVENSGVDSNLARFGFCHT